MPPRKARRRRRPPVRSDPDRPRAAPAKGARKGKARARTREVDVAIMFGIVAMVGMRVAVDEVGTARMGIRDDLAPRPYAPGVRVLDRTR